MNFPVLIFNKFLTWWILVLPPIDFSVKLIVTLLIITCCKSIKLPNHDSPINLHLHSATLLIIFQHYIQPIHYYRRGLALTFKLLNTVSHLR